MDKKVLEVSGEAKERTGGTTGVTTGVTTGEVASDRTNGMTSDMTSGMTSGMTSDMTSGITSGITSGMTSGMTSATTGELIAPEIMAVIAMALHDHESANMHDKESFVITIKKPAHSPWAQKQFTMRKYPVRK